MSERLDGLKWKLEQATRNDNPDTAIHWALYLAQEDIPALLAVAVEVQSRASQGKCPLCNREGAHWVYCPMAAFEDDE